MDSEVAVNAADFFLREVPNVKIRYDSLVINLKNIVFYEKILFNAATTISQFLRKML